MKILLCPDKFKGSLSASEVCEALREGLKRTYPDAEVRACPLADGGDGSLEVLARYVEGNWEKLLVGDPLGRPVEASYLRAGKTAYVELAAASGIVLLKPSERNALKTSSYGTGQLISHALQNGCDELYLFIGGSATNDGGIGIAEALGYSFWDAEGKRLSPVGENLVHIAKISKDDLIFGPSEINVTIICDVDNPFSGPNGAAHVYGPQKGANPEQVAWLDQGLRNLAEQIRVHELGDVQDMPGAGAAGGIGGGGVAFLGGNLKSGTDTFLEISQLERHVQQADLIITGEGKLDMQTVQGKLISGICQLARGAGKPIIGVCGATEAGVAQALGMQEVYTVMERSASLEEAMTQAAEKLREIGQRISL